jgi:hypothetical protein
VPPPPVELEDWQDVWVIGESIRDPYGRQIGRFSARPERPQRAAPRNVWQDFRNALSDTWFDSAHGRPPHVVVDRLGTDVWLLRRPGEHLLTVHDTDGRPVVEASRAKAFGGGASAVAVSHGVTWQVQNGAVRDGDGTCLGVVRGAKRRLHVGIEEPGRRLTTADAVRLRAVLLAIALEVNLTSTPNPG